MYINHQKTVFSEPFIFFLVLYFLVFISYISSGCTSIEFLYSLNTHCNSKYFPKILFLLFTLLYILKPKTGKIIYEFLTTSFLLDWAYNGSLKFEKFVKKKPLACFFFCYSYILLLLGHLFMNSFLQNVDLYFELFYHTFNIIRLFFFPLFIYGYILLYGPRIFNMFEFPNINSEEILKILKGIGSLLDETIQKHPKKIKVGVGILTLGIGTTLGSATYGSSVIDEAKRTIDGPLAAPLIQRLTQNECLANENCSQLLNDALRIFGKIEKNPHTITGNNLVAFAKGKPLLTAEVDSIIERLGLVHREAFREALKDKESAISKIVFSSENSAQVNETSVDIPSTSQVLALPKSTNPNTPLELLEFWSFF